MTEILTNVAILSSIDILNHASNVSDVLLFDLSDEAIKFVSLLLSDFESVYVVHQYNWWIDYVFSEIIEHSFNRFDKISIPFSAFLFLYIDSYYSLTVFLFPCATTFTFKFIGMCAVLIFARGGIPRFRYDLLTKTGWMQFLPWVLSFFLFTLTLTYIM